MQDQNSVPVDSQEDKWNRAVDLFIESVHKPDNTLRSCAHNQKCYNELMSIRARCWSTSKRYTYDAKELCD